eukprot:TRINITY_DN7420_c0_g1_i1.p1 TRINITY_DN7420_c0_g1~~TRINITY_DN7420_c0_g1_i1.p1  ORF type:complete len:378 (+),score=93.45 TRINITY_DN7420_c0_g1_i1:56-1135(+)
MDLQNRYNSYILSFSSEKQETKKMDPIPQRSNKTAKKSNKKNKSMPKGALPKKYDEELPPFSGSLCDIGANLTDRRYEMKLSDGFKGDIDQIIERATKAGVKEIMITAGNLKDSRKALAMAKKHPMLYCTVGVHPTRCDEFLHDEEKYMNDLRAVITEGMACGKVVAIGECGLDYDRLFFCSKEVQKKYFEKQFVLAEESGLPMFLHTRNTNGDFIEILRRHRDKFKGGCVHSFTDSWEEAEELLNDGLYIGINGCSLKTAENIETMKKIPLDRIMLETDCPYCDIRPTHAGFKHVKSRFPTTSNKKKFDGTTCLKGRLEPCHIRCVLEVVAAERELSIEEVAAVAHKNTFDVYFPDKS